MNSKLRIPLCWKDDAGQGIGQLMAAPFGGPNGLELGALLQRWNGGGAIVAGVTGTAGLITAVVASSALIAWGWPIVLLAILMVFFAVLVALATLLVRNALIVLLVMLAPLAFIAFVLPGADRYWKMWKDNLIRVLVFFPLVIALIYAGRIFAWIVAGLGGAGPFDLIMILAGFFGTYFFLPKTFKWAGPGMAAAANAINNSWAVKRGREATQKGLMGRQQRNLDQRAKGLDPSKEGYTRVTKRGWFGIPTGYSGNLGKTMLENVAAGRVIPTKRGLATAIQRGEKWNSEEDAIEAARVKREQDKAASDGDTTKTVDKDGNIRSSVSFSLQEDGTVAGTVSDNATARGKAALFNAAGSADERRAGVAVERALKTSSWVEVAKNLVPIENKALQDRIKASGAEWFPGNEKDPAARGKIFVRMYDLPRYNSKVNSSEDLYPLPLGKFLVATPHIGNPENYKPIGVRQEEENSAVARYNQEETQRAAAENRQPELRQPRIFVEDNSPLQRTETLEEINARETAAAKSEGRSARVLVRPHHIQRVISTIDDYIDAGNITSQSEAQFAEFGRLAKQDPDIAAHFGALLHRIATGGQGGINVLTQLNSSASMQNTIKDLLKPALNSRRGVEATLEDYLREGKQAMSGGEPESSQSSKQNTPSASNLGQGTGSNVNQSRPVVINQNEGTLVIQQPQPQIVQLRPGEVASPGGVVLTRGAQEELNSQFEVMRRELRDLKKVANRSAEQQSRLEEIQNEHPDWQDDDE